MISLYAIESVAADALGQQCEQRVSLILDCAEFYRWRENTDGTRTAFYILRKSIPGATKGQVLSLEKLHALLRP